MPFMSILRLFFVGFVPVAIFLKIQLSPKLL